MSRARGHAARSIAIPLPPLAPFHGEGLEPRGDYEAVEFVDCDFSGEDAADASFVECRMRRCLVDGLSLARARIAECWFEEVHGGRLDATGSACRDSVLSGVRLGALTASDATWSGVRIRGGKLNFVDLSASRLSHLTFESCEIGELDLTDADARTVGFVDCGVEILTVAGARLSNVDLSGARLTQLRGIDSLRGAVVSREQLNDLAPLLAEHLGLEVREV